jgi:6,7-dimethyl-8-ribityllumazine synthase
MSKILIISSQIHKDLSMRQLDHCLALMKTSPYHYEVEKLSVGTYEIPYVINTYIQMKPFDAYIALGLILKSNNDHYDYIMSHVKESFTRFAINNIIIGNGIIGADTAEELSNKVESDDPCFSAYASAYNAVHALLQFRRRLATQTS